MFKEYINLCKKLKLNLKKECTFTFMMVVALIALGCILMFVESSTIIGVMIIVYGFVYYFSHYSSLKSSYNQLVISKEIAFNGFYRYVITLLKNKHILYSALQASLQYIDEVLVDDVNDLIMEIENDTSIEPFLKFLDNFSDETIKQMILLLYKTQEVGLVDEVLNSINECMVYLQDSSIDKYIQTESKKVEKYMIYPIIFSVLVILIITSYVFSLIGSGSYV